MTTAGLGRTFEAEVIGGLESIAAEELSQRFTGKIEFLTGRKRQFPGALPFIFSGEPGSLSELRTVKAVYAWRRFDIPRPKALLGDQHMRQVLGLVRAVLELPGNQPIHSLYLSAAGSGSTVLTRFKDTLSQETGLTSATHEGDLWLRLRRPPDGSSGWDLLVRLTPRPLSTRSWRVCNMEGALNATVAYAMACLSRAEPDDVYLNLACGSGTLLIERLSLMGTRLALGLDLSQAALACARDNLAAAGLAESVSLVAGDGRRLPLRANEIDVICADLPFGQLVGSHDQNLDLYPAIMGECARVLRSGGRLVLITPEVRLMDRLLSGKPWAPEGKIQISLSGLHPRIYVLRKKS